MERPDPVRWLWYAMGGGLPSRYREWVLRDLTTRSWWARSLLRSLVQVAPFGVLILLFLPSEPWVRLMAVAAGILVGMIYAVAYLDEAAEHRALKAGFERGTVKAVRENADPEAREQTAARYGERYRGVTPPHSAGSNSAGPNSAGPDPAGPNNSG